MYNFHIVVIPRVGLMTRSILSHLHVQSFKSPVGTGDSQ